MKRITSEEPDLHWGFLDFKDKVVLDLGCGKFYSSLSTAEWFVKNGASKVIGIDLGTEIIDDDKFIYHTLNIDSTQKIKGLIETYKPHIIKADIEGAEKYFDDIKSDELGRMDEIAVEYHSNNLKLGFELKLLEWGFNIIDIYGLFNENIDRIGVIHAKRN
jgi:hypothetical protein